MTEQKSKEHSQWIQVRQEGRSRGMSHVGQKESIQRRLRGSQGEAKGLSRVGA